MTEFPILSTLTFLPLLGAIFIAIIQGEDDTRMRNARMVALWTSIITFALSIYMWLQFDPAKLAFQFVEKRVWVPQFNLTYHMGVDGLSMLFVVLTAFLTPICILASWTSIKKRIREYMVAFLVLESLLIGMFCALDIILFYVFFEAVLIPMVLIIGIWGGERRIYSCYKFFLYTLLGSVLMLVAMLTTIYETGSSDIMAIANYSFDIGLQKWLWLGFFIAFAVKVPMWPVHTWLPDAHVEAPTAGSVILAGVLLKMGGYGFVRLILPFFPEATIFFSPLVVALSLIAIVYTSLVALSQEDMKKLIAYSSIAHMGFVTLGIVTLTPQGVSGAMIQMISHGLVSAALFLAVGVIYDRFHTREIAFFGGLVKKMPKYAVFTMLFILASIGVPGTSGFVGEFAVIMGTFTYNTWVATVAASAMVLGAAYSLWLYRRVVFGSLKNTKLSEATDLNLRELGVFTAIAATVMWMGIYPKPFLQVINPAVNHLLLSQQNRIVSLPESTVNKDLLAMGSK